MNKNNETLQDKLQEQERKKNRVKTIIKFGAIFLIVLMCLGGGYFKGMEWFEEGNQVAAATAAVVETRQAMQTATAEEKAPTPGWDDPAEIVKLSVEQWYNVDYTSEFEDWATEMCKYTTRYACEKEVYNLGNNNWNDNVVPKQWRYTVEVTPAKMIWEQSFYDVDVGRNMDTQIWEYDAVASDRPGTVYTRYVMIGNEGAGWLLVHDLWDEEAAELLQEISAEAIPELPET